MTDWTLPEQIIAWLRRRWQRGDVLAAYVTGEPLFPLELPLKRPTARELTDRFGDVMDWVEQLRARSSERMGRGYTLRWESRGNRVQGVNDLPVSACIATDADALHLLGEQKSARRFRAIADEILSRYPVLGTWLARRPMLALAHADDWPRLLAVLDHFVRHPRPGLYLRQLEILEVDTKFIEARRGLLAELLDAVLAPDHIDASATGTRGFARRYGLRTEPALVRFRILDPAISVAGLTDVSIPADDFARMNLPVRRVFITENLTNGLAMPHCADSLVVFGLGYGIDRLAEVAWLREREVWYWGDIDTHGFGILNRLRGLLPHARSLLMDRETLLAHRSLWGSEPADRRYRGDSARLTDEERALFVDLREDRLAERVRLEQERIGFRCVRAAIERAARVIPASQAP
jgi:hypothetical protein